MSKRDELARKYVEECDYVSSESRNIAGWGFLEGFDAGQAEALERAEKAEAENRKAVAQLAGYEACMQHRHELLAEVERLTRELAELRESLSTEKIRHSLYSVVVQLRDENAKLIRDMHLAVSNAGKDLIAERDALAAQVAAMRAALEHIRNPVKRECCKQAWEKDGCMDNHDVQIADAALDALDNPK